jgi:hypothetical protein
MSIHFDCIFQRFATLFKAFLKLFNASAIQTLSDVRSLTCLIKFANEQASNVEIEQFIQWPHFDFERFGIFGNASKPIGKHRASVAFESGHKFSYVYTSAL